MTDVLTCKETREKAVGCPVTGVKHQEKTRNRCGVKRQETQGHRAHEKENATTMSEKVMAKGVKEQTNGSNDKKVLRIPHNQTRHTASEYLQCLGERSSSFGANGVPTKVNRLERLVDLHNQAPAQAAKHSFEVGYRG